MRIEISNDRRLQERRSDPVARKEGIFAQLHEDELTEAEKNRAAHLSECIAKLEARPQRAWLPKDVLRSITRLYRKFSKPKRG